MRDLVTRPSYRIRKAMDDFLFWLMPDFWVPLYNSVTFTTMPYSQCVKNREWQNKVISILFYLLSSYFHTLFIFLFNLFKIDKKYDKKKI